MKEWSTALLFSVIALAGIASAGTLPPAGDLLLRASGTKGGVVAVLGCNDGKAVAAFHAGPRFLVHGLDTDAGRVNRARAAIDALGLYGSVAVETYDGRNLPYGDRIVNLLVVDDPASVDVHEIERVLVPRGVVMLRAGSQLLAGAAFTEGDSIPGWHTYIKPWPSEIDQWTHFLYDASGNAVSKDTQVHRPRHVQWYAGPKRTRHHDALASLSAMTSSTGRLFYIFDEGPTSVVHRPAKWRLVARDAFNGKLLWKREIPQWMTHLYNFRAGPQQLPRRLVSVGDSVYVTLGLCAPVVKLDGATGETQLTYPNSDGAEELVCHRGMLLAVIGDPSILTEEADGCYGYWQLTVDKAPTPAKSIVAYDAASGKRLWTVSGDNLRYTVPLSLCALDDHVFYLDNQALHCLDAASGKERWASPFETSGLFIRSYAPTVVAHADVIMCLTWKRFCGYAIGTGAKLWETKGAIGFGSPGDLFAIGGTAWTVPMTKAIWRESARNKAGVITTGITIPKSTFLNDAKTAVGVDMHSGELTDLLPFAHTQHHHRCYRNKATEQYLLLGHSGIQVVDLQSKTNETNRWVRGLCQYGIMPANGCLYVPPDPCRCYSQGKINGFFALSDTNSWEDVKLVPVLEKGPAYGQPAPSSGRQQPAGNDWPSYRGNSARSASTTTTIPASPKIAWRTEIGPTLTSPVVAAGRAFVAERDAFAIHCLSMADGKPVWKYLANGPVDSPPTIHGGLCIFGCADGSVTCLEAANGHLVWRFRTSKLERRIGYDDRLASPLRIHGSTLVQGNTVYFAAGYSSNLDGGIRVYGVDVRTGEQRCTATLASGPWGNDGQWGFLDDILVSDGTRISMRSVSFDAALKRINGRGSLVASTGLLDDSWYHREGWSSTGRVKGQLIAFDGARSFSAVNPYTGLKQRRKGKYAEFNQFGHFHQKFTRYREEFFPVGSTITSIAGRRGQAGWPLTTDLQPRAMVLAGDKLCVAGWLDAVVIEMKTGQPKDPDNPDPRHAVLRIYAAADGKLVSESNLDAEPVFDGLAAASGHLLLSLNNGTLISLGE